MAREQIGLNGFIVQAVAEASRMTVQIVAPTCMARQGYAEIKMSGPILKQSTFNLSAEDKYVDLQNFEHEHEVSNMLQIYNLG